MKTEKLKGIVKFFNRNGGWGFITDETGKDIFFHHTGLNGISVEAGDRVQFTTGQGKKGVCATDIEVVPNN